MELKTRDQIDEKYKWDLSKIYSSDEAWEKDFIFVKNNYQTLLEYRGTLNQPASLLKFLKSYEDLFIKVENLLTYAFMRFSEDTGNQKYQELKGRGELLMSEIEPELIFIKKELSSLTADDLKKMIEQESGLGSYNYFIENYSRYQPHILGDEAEQALAEVSVALGMPSNIFHAFNDTNVVFPEFEHKGEVIKLTHGTFIENLHSADRELRQKTYKYYSQPFHQNIDVIAGCYSANVLAAIKQAKVRKFNSSLEMSLFDDRLSPEIHAALVNTAKQASDVVNEFNQMKKDYFGVEELHFYDTYAPLVKTPSRTFEYLETVSIVRDSLKSLGDVYLEKYDASVKNRVIDVYESQKKQSGAYSCGTYSSHGFLFLNYTGKLNDVNTFAHEFGHCLHRDFSCATQPFYYSDNPLFLAEIASTFNECLLFDDLIKNSQSNEEKKGYVYKYLINLYQTFFRQTMFADFEMQAHAMAERGEVLTAHSLTEVYRSILPNYLGSVVTLDDDVSIEWARIPHFYRPFYVFKYATSLSAAIILSDRVINQEPDAVENYLTFLSAGSHKPPLEILKDAGIDMTKSGVYEGTVKKFREMLDLFKSL